MEDFGKVYHRGSTNFQMHLTSLWFLDQVYFIRSRYLIVQMSLSVWHSHSPCGRCFWNLPQGVCGIQMELANVCRCFAFSLRPNDITISYRLITVYLLLRVNLDKIMHARWDFDASSARTRKVSALDKHQNWSASALFCRNSRAQSKYAVVNLIHTQRKQTFLSFIMW